MHNYKLLYLALLLVLTSTVQAHELSDSDNLWRGFYLGGFVGGAAGTHTRTPEPLRLDNGNYWFRPFHNSYSYNTDASFIGGGTIGYNWQIEKSALRLGLEAEYGYLNEQGSHMDSNQIPYAALANNTTYNSSSHNTNIGGSYGYGLIGGRIGYALEHILFYVKSGAVFTNTKTTYSSIKTEGNITASLHTSGAGNTAGYGVGGGVEYLLPFKAFTNISVKIEYLYLGIDRTQSSYGYCSCNDLWTTADRIDGIHTVKLGVNYNF